MFSCCVVVWVYIIHCLLHYFVLCMCCGSLDLKIFLKKFFFPLSQIHYHSIIISEKKENKNQTVF